MKIIWSESAKKDRSQIIDYIAEDNPGAALVVDSQISATVARISQFPASGRIGKIPGTREVVIGKYILVYEISPKHIDILQIVHSARQYPPL